MSAALVARADSDSIARWAEPGRCGTNALYAMLRLSGHEVDFDDVYRATPVDPRHGATLQELADAAASLGVQVDVRRVQLSDIPRLATPFIAHLDLADVGGSGHFIVVSRVVKIDKQWQISAIDGSRCIVTDQDLENLRTAFLGFVLMPADPRPVGWVGDSSLEWGAAAVGLVIGSLGARKYLRQSQHP